MGSFVKGMMKLERRVIEKIIDIVGKENVYTNKEDRICYSYDATFQRQIPGLVVLPGSVQEIQAVVRLANLEKIPLFPRGAGTGLSGGSIPMDTGIAVVLTRLNSIKEINKNDMLCVVEPGVVTEKLQHQVDKAGLFYPPDPASLKTCTIGGNVAENAGGPRALKYGVTRNYVMGLQVITPTGEIMHVGGRTVKNVTGYDLTGLLTGSEGTLGIITEAILRLLPKPKAIKTALVTFKQLEDAAAAVSGMILEGVTPTTLEIMDKITIICVERHVKLGLPLDVESILIIEVDGSETAVNEDMERVKKVCQKFNCGDFQIASGVQERDALWKARRSVSSAVVQLKPTKISEDATVPRSRIPEMVKRLNAIGKKYDLFLPVFGHAGDGNLHPNIIVDKNDKEEMQRVEKATEEIFKAALELGGTLSGEHGIGTMKKPFLELELGAVGIEYLRAIKKAVDPNNILNPGKII
ncbi:FAD-binding oxidoreductase [Desulfitibacter alkalitolerans]|uniref:FAD-binding oxidoreductase n=1 Tax=Desulfitibacter alkalitolerans TaxID=264641 RepID=UPI000A431E0F|nr:FAD-linked oxidase C-terminal domain-containing protein [Desulfitibacter alkalitolerans]